MNNMLQQKASKQGIESFALGITGLLLHLIAFFIVNCFFWCESVALIVGIAGLTLGIISRKKLKENNRLGLAGAILSALTLIGFALAIVYLTIALSRVSNAISAIAGNPW